MIISMRCMVSLWAVAIVLPLGCLPCTGQVVIQPRIQNLSVVQGTNIKTFRMWVPTQTTVNYTAQRTSQLMPASWFAVTNFPSSGALDMVSDTIGSTASRFYRVAVDPRPWVRNQPLSRNIQIGDTVQLDVVTTGLLPLQFQWYGPNGTLTNDVRVSGSTTPNLLISNMDPGDVGNYWVTITNFYGSTSSVPAGVRITLSQAPRILIDPQGQTLLLGQTVNLWSSANGAQPLNYSWFGPAGILGDGGRVSGSTTTNLTVANLDTTDDGGYYMVVSNVFGVSTSAVATVRIQLGQSPRITVDPQSQTVIAGQTVNLLVTASGTPPLDYRWHGPSGTLADGGPISGATTTNLSIANFQSGDDGDYFVVVTNAFGTATSATASVRVQ